MDLTKIYFVLVTDPCSEEEHVFESRARSPYPLITNGTSDQILLKLPTIARLTNSRVRLVEGYDFKILIDVKDAHLHIPTLQTKLRTAVAFFTRIPVVAYRTAPSGLPTIPLIFGLQHEIQDHVRFGLLDPTLVPVLMSLRTIQEIP